MLTVFGVMLVVEIAGFQDPRCADGERQVRAGCLDRRTGRGDRRWQRRAAEAREAQRRGDARCADLRRARLDRRFKNSDFTGRSIDMKGEETQCWSVGMRSVLGLAFVGLLGCQDPRCGEGEQRIGTACRSEVFDAVDRDDGGSEEDLGSLDAATDMSTATNGVPHDGGVGSLDATSPVDKPATTMGDASSGKVFGCAPRQCAEWPISEPHGKLFPLFSNDAETVTDQVTKLVWQRRESSFVGTYAEAVRHCDALSLGGLDDWRLPSLMEIRSLYDASREPSRIVKEVYLPEDSVYPPPYWWTTAVDIEGVRIAFHMTLGAATALRVPADTPVTIGVRCVRGGLVAAGSRYTISDDGSVVTDNWTKLIWRRRVESGLLTSQEATARCESLAFGWRLPTTKELYSLVVPTLEPTIDREAFPDTPVGPFWAKDHGKLPEAEEYVNFGAWGPYAPGAKYGIRDSDTRPFRLHVRCVR